MGKGSSPEAYVKKIKGEMEAGKFGDACETLNCLEWSHGGGRYFNSQRNVVVLYGVFKHRGFVSRVKSIISGDFKQVEYVDEDLLDDEADYPINLEELKQDMKARRNIELQRGHYLSAWYIGDVISMLGL